MPPKIRWRAKGWRVNALGDVTPLAGVGKHGLGAARRLEDGWARILSWLRVWVLGRTW